MPIGVALMLNLIGADWKPVFVDFFVGGETRTEKYRTEINEMGEVPVLAHGARKLSQSAVCLTYLAGRSGKFRPEGDDEQLECLRWIVFDNQKVNGFLGPYRFLKNFAPAPNPGGEAFLLGRIGGNLAIVNKRLEKAPYLLGARADHRRHIAGRICLLSRGRVRFRHRQGSSGDRCLDGAHQGAAGVEAPL